MEMNKIEVEVVYASPSKQLLITCQVKLGSTIQQAIELSGILSQFPEIDLSQQKVGIFGKQRKLTDLVQAGDRIEIYRPLIIDPKKARRNRAARR